MELHFHWCEGSPRSPGAPGPGIVVFPGMRSPLPPQLQKNDVKKGGTGQPPGCETSETVARGVSQGVQGEMASNSRASLSSPLFPQPPDSSEEYRISAPLPAPRLATGGQILLLGDQMSPLHLPTGQAHNRNRAGGRGGSLACMYSALSLGRDDKKLRAQLGEWRGRQGVTCKGLRIMETKCPQSLGDPRGHFSESQFSPL